MDRDGHFDAGTVADCLLEPVFAVNTYGKISFVNARLLEVFRVSQDAAVGSDISWLKQFIADGFDTLSSAVTSVFRGEAEDRRVKLGMRHPPSAPVPYQLTAEARVAPLIRDGQRLGVLVTLRDITVRHQRRERLRVLSRVLRHNVRNQLNLVLGLDGIATELEDEQKQDRVEKAVEAAERLYATIERSRSIERQIAGKSDPSSQDLVHIVSEVAAEIRDEYPDTVIEDPVGESVYGDVTKRFTAAVEEVIRNAIEHNDNPEPRVEIGVTKSHSGEYIDVWIADNGPGIEPAQAEIAGGKRQVDQATTHLEGLGLWAVRWIVQSCRGDLKFRSNDPRGTIVTLRVPRSKETDNPE